MGVHGDANNGNRAMTWQRGAVWMARTGYGELELSTFMTVRRLSSQRRRVPAAEPIVFPMFGETELESFAAD